MNQLLVTLYAWHLTAIDKLRERRDAGQGSLEYIAAIAVAAAIVVVVIAAANQAQVGDFVTAMIDKIRESAGG